MRKILELAPALDAIEKILRYSGVEKFVQAGIKVAQDSATDPEEDVEEDDRAARRKRPARKYAAPSA